MPHKRGMVKNNVVFLCSGVLLTITKENLKLLYLNGGNLRAYALVTQIKLAFVDIILSSYVKKGKIH